VVWVGGWLDVKGRVLLPRLWGRVRHRLADATLTLIGTGAEAAVVLPAFDSPDRESIVVVPRVENAAGMRQLYASGHAYLLTSLSEGSPLSLLEAMAAGLPAVATRVGGVPDIATDGTQAVLFSPEHADAGADALCRVLEDPALARRLGTAARDRARELTWDHTAETIAGALRTTTASGRTA
jgi:glycosyltransferase involved in cell wall biosynthesis